MFNRFFIGQKKTSSPLKSLFIHIPKAGGSTFVGLLKESFKHNIPDTVTHKTEKVGNVSIKHIDFSTTERPFKEPDIFDINKDENYNDQLLFLLLRNPVKRLISEFNFQYHILNGKNGNKQAAILSQLKKQPKNFEEYIRNKETQNYQLKFLLGRPINDPTKVTQAELDKVIERIDNMPIYCGVTDEYASFLNLFESKTQISLPKKVLIRKKTPFLYHTELNQQTKEMITSLNKFDAKLYAHIKKYILVNNKKFKFIEKDQFII